MESTNEMMTAVALAAALLPVLRWILGGTRRRPAPRRSRPAPAGDAWGHVEMRRRALRPGGAAPDRTR